MGTMQKHFRSMMNMSVAVMMMGGKQRKKWMGDNGTSMFGKTGYSGISRLMLTLPPIKQPVQRTIAVKSRKLAMRREKRQRIDTRGYN